MQLKTKFVSVSLFSIFCVSVLIYESFSTIWTLEAAAKKVEVANTISRYQDDIDKMHDAVRSEVTSAITYFNSGNKDGATSASNVLKTHLEEMQATVKSALTLELPVEIHNEYNEISDLVDEYSGAASSAINNLSDANATAVGAASLNNVYIKLSVLNSKLNQEVEEFLKDIKSKSDSIMKTSVRNFSIIATLALIFVIFVPIFITTNIFRPQTKMIEVLHKVLGGDTNQEVPFLDRKDEIGSVANVLETVRHSMSEKQELEEKAKLQAKQAEEDRRNNLLVIANKFETTVKGIVDMVAAAATEMDATARDLQQNATNAQGETKQLSESSSKTNTNIQGVSKATSEFNNAANEISSQVANSREYAHKLSEQTVQVNSVVVDLESKANAINSIIDIINNITSQIDLLALNATIEAARAGDMGKGFAVVANEVKALATQTSKATEQINVQISSIQASTSKAVSSIQEITDSIKTINQNSTSIASAVEEQNATSAYIAESVNQVALMSNAFMASMEKVASSSAHSEVASGQMVSAVDNLLQQSNVLQDEVNKFLTYLKSA